MRNYYLVTYDICESKRLRRTFKTMRRYGNHLQLSVFLCELSQSERVRMTTDLRDVIHMKEDSVLMLNLGPVGPTAASRFELGTCP